MNILLIYRAKEFSPNLVDNDTAILDKVGHYLQEAGCNISFIHEEEFSAVEYDVDVVMSMCRRTESLNLLTKMEEKGILIVNSPQSVLNCSRDKMYHILCAADIPVANEYDDEYRFPLWFKNRQGWSKSKDDVVFISNATELKRVISSSKGKPYMLFEHLEGDLIKFYGVEDSSFFFWMYASENHSKYNLEQHNGAPHHYPFLEEQLHHICSDAAKAMGLTAYGGDCIIDSNGMIKIIDFNDWPSFSKCRENASKAIAATVLKRKK